MNSDFFTAYKEYESYGTFSPELVIKHQCSLLLGIDSSLNFIIRLLEDLLYLYDYWKDRNISLYSLQFFRYLKSLYLSLLTEKLIIHQILSKYFHIFSTGDVVSFDYNYVKNRSIELLKGEELNLDHGATSVLPSMSVWNTYVDSELLNFNHNQAHKVRLSYPSILLLC